MTKLIFLFFILFTGCGDSPFLSDESQPVVRGDHLLDSDLSFAQSEIRIKVFWRVGPLIGDESQLLLVLHDKNGRPASVKGKLDLMLWMPTMGHGSFPVKVSEIGMGIYEAKDVFFTMPGLWDIHFQIKELGTDQIIEDFKWPLNL